MSDKVAATPGERTANGIRIALGLSGVVALIVGILVLAWPGKTAVVVAAIVATYAVIGGLVYAALGIFSKSLGGWAKIGHILLGVLYIVAGVIAFLNLSATALWLAMFLGILVGIMWMFEGIVALTALGGSSSKGWTIFFALLSIVAGVLMLFAPVWGAVVLWWMLGISLVVLGLVQIIRAFSFGKKSAL